MKISIAMATYNGARFIRAQLESFVAQTRQPNELIITDDCSTDETEVIVREFAKTAPFDVKFYRNEKNLGFTGNFNSALIKTTGDLVFLSDQDDVWFPEKVRYMLHVAELNPEALVIMNDAALTDSYLNEVGLTKLGQIRSAGLSMDSFVMGCCAVVRRELLELCMPIPVDFQGHDNWLVWFADGLNAKVFVPEVLQYYRRHESNESQFIANSIKKVTRMHTLLHSIKSVFRKDSVNRTRVQLEQLRIYADGVRIVQGKAPEKYHRQLFGLEDRFRKKLETIEKRIVVRDKRLVLRLFAVCSLLKNGGYQHTSGIKALLRDIVG